MNEAILRRWHRRIGFALAPLLILQALSGLFLSIPYLYGAQERVHSLLVGRKMPSLAKFWSFLLVDIHTGGGVLGSWHNWLTGTGMVFLSVSGVLIFLKIQARLRWTPAKGPARVAAPDGFPLPEPSLELGRILGCRRRSYTILAAGVLSILLMTVYTHFRAYRIANLDTVLTLVSSDITLQGSLAHLEQEELLSKERRDGWEIVLARLDRVEVYLKAMLEGGITPLGIVLPPDDPSLREKLSRLREAFLEFRRISEARGAFRPPGEQDLALAMRYDKAFETYSALAEEAKNSIGESFGKDLSSFRSILRLLASLGVLLTGIIAMEVYRLERRRSEDEKRIDKARAQCETRFVDPPGADPSQPDDGPGP